MAHPRSDRPQDNEEIDLSPEQDAALDAALDRRHAERTLDERADVMADILGGLAGEDALGAIEGGAQPG